MGVAFSCYGYILLALCRRIYRIRQEERHERTLLVSDEWSTDVVHGRFEGVPHCSSIRRFLSSREFRNIWLFLVILMAFTFCLLQYLINRVRIVTGWHRQSLPPGYDLQPPPGYFLWMGDLQRNLMELFAYANALVNPLLLFFLGRSYCRGLISLKRFWPGLQAFRIHARPRFYIDSTTLQPISG